jgi:CheY-like chemotaxis protein
MNAKPIVMVVDDSSDTLLVIKMGLVRSGYEVHDFTNPTEALTHIEQGCTKCELLVTDVRMPSMSGFELVRKVKALRPEIKVVLMTAFEVNLPELHTILPSFPADSVIRKPFMPSKLLEIIKPLYASGNS